MGWYIQAPVIYGRTEYLIAHHEAVEIEPVEPSNLPPDKALVVVVQNGLFDAVGYVFDDREFREFSDPTDPTPRRWLLMDKAFVEAETGYIPRD
jgi:hypothetical protein